MNTIELRPLVGLGPILLGAGREDVVETLGQPEKSFQKSPKSRHKTDCWFNGAVQVFYGGDDPTVEFVEVSAGLGTEALVFGKKVFSTEAGEIVAWIETKAARRKNDGEAECTYVFPALELSLWRADPGERAFQTVGIGVRGYYSNAV